MLPITALRPRMMRGHEFLRVRSPISDLLATWTLAPNSCTSESGEPLAQGDTSFFVHIASWTIPALVCIESFCEETAQSAVTPMLYLGIHNVNFPHLGGYVAMRGNPNPRFSGLCGHGILVLRTCGRRITRALSQEEHSQDRISRPNAGWIVT